MHTVFSRSQESAQGLAREFALPKATTDMKQAVEDPNTDVVIIGLPNDTWRPFHWPHLQAKLSCVPNPSAAQQPRRNRCCRPSSRRAFSPDISRPRLSTQDTEGHLIGGGWRPRQGPLGTITRDQSRPPFGLVLGRGTRRRWCDDQHGMPLCGDHPELRGQAESPRRGHVLERHARPSRHSRGSRHRADPLRIGGHRSNRGELGLSWWHGSAR